MICESEIVGSNCKITNTNIMLWLFHFFSEILLKEEHTRAPQSPKNNAVVQHRFSICFRLPIHRL